MKRNNKKGFTIVELVIVIAVIAILAAVLIPTFSSIVKKANVSKDTQLIRNLNTALASDTVKHETMKDALDAAYEFGYDVAKINASATNNEILWDSQNDVFCYLNEGEIQYIPETTLSKTATDVDYWVISDTVSTTYSTYLYGYTEEAVTAVNSLDVTACGAVDVTYSGSAAVSIYTNGGSLNVNSGAVTHYGVGYILTIAESAKSAYVEKGTFAANADDIDNAGDKTTAETAGYTYVTTKDELTNALANKKAKIALGANIAIEASPSIGNDFVVVAPTELNLNGYNITSVHNSNTGVNKNNGVFYIEKTGSLSIVGSGEITFSTNNQMGWNACTYVIAGKGDVTIDGAVKIANLGGTDMSYAIDMYSWGTKSSANVTIKSGMVYSAEYCAIRLYRQGNTASDITTTFNLVIDGGVVQSAVKSAIFTHDGSEASDGIYNITINGGEVVSAGTRPLVATWGWASETVNIVDNR